MNSWFKHPVRVTGRLLWLGWRAVIGLLAYIPQCAFRPRDEVMVARARWLQVECQRGLRIFGTQLEVVGPVPAKGIMVCNHLSYMDILVISACTPVLFVAKREVKGWPVFGWFARLAGTLFVHRENRTQVGQVAQEIGTALQRGALVVLFAEGTSSDGKEVLPFKSSLLEPVTRNRSPITAALVTYELADGDVGEEVCYWKDMTLVPHLLNLMSKESLRARICFKPSEAARTDRKALARQLHAEVAGMLVESRTTTKS
jgi:1-acyl-sn-glycerol-3-phosphate acyltransferase